MRVLFAGSPEIAIPSLIAIGSNFELVGVLSNPDAPCGRGRCLTETALAEAAGDLFPGLPVIKADRLGPSEREAVAALRPELLAVFAFGTIFGPKFLSLFPDGAINAHPSLLPRWRGCAPLAFAIMNHDAETGVSIQKIAPRLDSGDLLGVVKRPLSGDETAESLADWASEAAAGLFVEVINNIRNKTIRPWPQNESEATYCNLLKKEDGLIDWNMSARDIAARIRAFKPWPGTWTLWSGANLNILEARAWPEEAEDSQTEPGRVLHIDKSRGIMVKTAEGLLALEVLQLKGKKPLPFRDFINGARGLPGSLLGE